MHNRNIEVIDRDCRIGVIVRPIDICPCDIEGRQVKDIVSCLEAINLIRDVSICREDKRIHLRVSVHSKRRRITTNIAKRDGHAVGIGHIREVKLYQFTGEVRQIDLCQHRLRAAGGKRERCEITAAGDGERLEQIQRIGRHREITVCNVDGEIY